LFAFCERLGNERCCHKDDKGQASLWCIAFSKFERRVTKVAIAGPIAFSTGAILRAQPGQSCEVVGSHRQDEPGTDTLYAAIHDLCHATDYFGPAERFFDLLSVLLGQGIAPYAGWFGHRLLNFSISGRHGA